MTQEPVAVSGEPKHNLRYENRFIRVYEVVVPPGEATLFHYHENDYFYVNLADAGLKSETPGESGLEMTVEEGQLIYTAAPVTHRMRNVGKNTFHNFTVELLGPPPQSRVAGPPPGKNQAIIFENDRIRAVRTLLPPAASTGLHEHDCGVFTVRVGAGAIRMEAAGGKASAFREGWHDSPLTHSLDNIGADAACLIEIEVKSSKYGTRDV